MTIPQSLLQASTGVGLSSLDREQAERFRKELENYRQELFNQIDTAEFRAKAQTEQRAEIDLMVRLFREQVSRRMQDKMHKAFSEGGAGKSLVSSQVSINNPLRGQTIKGSLNQESQKVFVMLSEEIVEQKKLL
jgi:predicted HicB family RNase H-like nuclease